MGKRILIVGAGLIAAEYAKILSALGHEFIAVGRGAASAEAFQALTGQAAHTGGIEAWLANHDADRFDAAIIAVPAQDLSQVAGIVIDAGMRNILIEKPGGGTPGHVRSLARKAADTGTDIRVAYNRRFYASTRAAVERIAADGGPSSFVFEFTEWSHKIEPLEKPALVKRNWLLGNSSHVIDMAFFLGGEPAAMNGFVSGTLSMAPARDVRGSRADDRRRSVRISCGLDGPRTMGGGNP